jgi:hypothetical protein
MSYICVVASINNEIIRITFRRQNTIPESSRGVSRVVLGPSSLNNLYYCIIFCSYTDITAKMSLQEKRN